MQRLIFCIALPVVAEWYCPGEEDFYFDGGAHWDGNGWTIVGGGGAKGKTSYNLLGGYMSFDMDSSGATFGMNNNFYTISPDHPYTNPNDYCDGQGPEASSPLGIYCMELDIIEANGNGCASTSWHTWYNRDGDCDQDGCNAVYGWSGGHVDVLFDNDGWMHTYINGNEVGSGYGTFDRWPSDNAKHQIQSEMSSKGAVIMSTQWSGWVPGDCGSGGDNPNSRFSIHNVEIGGTVVMGPEPRKCGQRCAEFCSSTGCGWTSEWSCPWQPTGSKGQASDDGSDGYDCCCKKRTAESQPCGGGSRGSAFNTTRPYLI